MEELKNDLINIIDEIENITDGFYKNQEKAAYDKLYQAIPGMGNVIEKIINFKYNNNLDIDEKNIVKALGEAINALEKKDAVLLADILQYELSEQFKELINII